MFPFKRIAPGHLGAQGDPKTIKECRLTAGKVGEMRVHGSFGKPRKKYKYVMVNRKRRLREAPSLDGLQRQPEAQAMPCAVWGEKPEVPVEQPIGASILTMLSPRREDKKREDEKRPRVTVESESDEDEDG